MTRGMIIGSLIMLIIIAVTMFMVGFMIGVEHKRKHKKACEYCSGVKTEYQYTHNTKISFDKFGNNPILLVESNGCPPYANCVMKDAKICSAFHIQYCPNCGRKLVGGRE